MDRDLTEAEIVAHLRNGARFEAAEGGYPASGHIKSMAADHIEEKAADIISLTNQLEETQARMFKMTQKTSMGIVAMRDMVAAFDCMRHLVNSHGTD
tara:strand:+ start:1347 stop:1637 length:291 start_codon:yes stop_codon:yes gene_type:complete